MSKKIKLTNIELVTSKGDKIKLTIEEARELHAQFVELFGTKTEVNYPIIVERDRWTPYVDPYPYKPIPMWYGTTCEVESGCGMNVSYIGTNYNKESE